VNVYLLDKQRRALATSLSESYKYAECVSAFFELVFLMDFILSGVEVFSTKEKVIAKNK